MPPEDLSTTEVQRLLDERIPRSDWKDSNARRGQVIAVAKRTLSAGPDSRAELTEIRNKKQKAVAQDMGLRTRTVMDKCGRQLYQGYANVPNNDYHKEFDEMLWDIYRTIDC